MRVIAVGGAAGRAQARFGLPDTMPAPHADLVAAFAWVEGLVGEVEFFAAERANFILAKL